MAKQKTTKRNLAVIGAGAAVAAAAVAGVYFLYGKGGAARRKKIRSWALKAKGEVLEELERLQSFDREQYYRIIERVAKRYGVLQHVHKGELQALVRELRGHWKNISGATKKGGAKNGAVRKRKPARRST